LLDRKSEVKTKVMTALFYLQIHICMMPVHKSTSMVNIKKIVI